MSDTKLFLQVFLNVIASLLDAFCGETNLKPQTL